ncbi:MAG TPA: hypothetical protein VFR58_04870 [Flavisolibacter sp.]|nr:hypothetical protein [Flavisolibacter sp.]
MIIYILFCWMLIVPDMAAMAQEDSLSLQKKMNMIDSMTAAIDSKGYRQTEVIGNDSALAYTGIALKNGEGRLARLSITYKLTKETLLSYFSGGKTIKLVMREGSFYFFGNEIFDRQGRVRPASSFQKYFRLEKMIRPLFPD